MKVIQHPFSNIFFPLLFSIINIQGFSMNVNVRIYSSESLTSVLISPKSGRYVLEGDGKIIDSCFASSVYEVSAAGNMLEVKTLNHKLGKFSELYLRGVGQNNQFNIKPVSSKVTRIYDDELKLSVVNSKLLIINTVLFEHYLAGVVEWEGGSKATPEFFKVQAIICRTWALNNLGRHETENYELCDLTHCQVYRSASSVPAILQAVEATKGIVIVDGQGKLITAAFHSNCGGYTQNSEDVWTLNLNYLRSVKDTFCLNQLHANWERHFTLNEWDNFLEKIESGLKKDNIHPKAYYDSIPEERKLIYYDKGYLIPLKSMRFDLNLQSTYFSVEKKGNEIILNGKGNGHRVGLCQEGAIHMAQKGYTYKQILQFYYKGVQLVDSSMLPALGTK